ncbi:hypothetical protein [Rhizobium sp. RU36D]|uniref:hypothetical protein n=1 Tax=Rhizobium sp. RU36D TaxID=1907415 RepID=UPI0009D82BC7|nr:hypothetical protein [Rhizobium sp. RU36D]SMC81993.1 hypothetical protein SAMN05880593_107179 [Rhizobium sp. RU36D]
MTQVVTVSAHTAAYVAEAMKTPPKVSRSTHVKETRKSVDKEAPSEDIYTAQISATVSDSTSSALKFMTGGHQSKQNASLQATLEAYESF